MNPLYDFKKSIEVMLDSKEEHYDRIYFKSNENIRELFNNFDFSGKDILSIVGSGDQAFEFIKRDCNSIELFDKNRLSMYYFYLRKWFMEYYGYKNINKRRFFTEEEYLEELLSKVIPKSKEEELALEYWNYISSRIGKRLLKKLFYLSNKDDLTSYGVVDCSDIKMYDLDITKKIKLGKKYDVVFLFNILEYYTDSGKLSIVKDNLDKLTKSNGIVLCDPLDYYFVKEKEFMSDMFDCKFYEDKTDSLLYGKDIGYSYTKNRC